MYPGNGGVFNKAIVQSIALLLNTGSLDIIARAMVQCMGFLVLLERKTSETTDVLINLHFRA